MLTDNILCSLPLDCYQLTKFQAEWTFIELLKQIL